MHGITWAAGFLWAWFGVTMFQMMASEQTQQRVQSGFETLTLWLDYRKPLHWLSNNSLSIAVRLFSFLSFLVTAGVISSLLQMSAHYVTQELAICLVIATLVFVWVFRRPNFRSIETDILKSLAGEPEVTEDKPFSFAMFLARSFRYGIFTAAMSGVFTAVTYTTIVLIWKRSIVFDPSVLIISIVLSGSLFYLLLLIVLHVLLVGIFALLISLSHGIAFVAKSWCYWVLTRPGRVFQVLLGFLASILTLIQFYGTE